MFLVGMENQERTGNRLGEANGNSTYIWVKRAAPNKRTVLNTWGKTVSSFPSNHLALSGCPPIEYWLHEASRPSVAGLLPSGPWRLSPRFHQKGENHRGVPGLWDWSWYECMISPSSNDALPSQVSPNPTWVTAHVMWPCASSHGWLGQGQAPEMNPVNYSLTSGTVEFGPWYQSTLVWAGPLQERALPYDDHLPFCDRVAETDGSGHRTSTQWTPDRFLGPTATLLVFCLRVLRDTHLVFLSEPLIILTTAELKAARSCENWLYWPGHIKSHLRHSYKQPGERSSNYVYIVYRCAPSWAHLTP